MSGQMPSGTDVIPPATANETRAIVEAEFLALRPLVFAVARRMTGDENRAEDLVQETYLRAIRSQDQYRTGSNCKAWLLTILRSVQIDAARHDISRGGSHAQLPAEMPSRPERSDLPMDSAAFMNVMDLMVDDDIKAAMLNLPELYREAFVLVVIGELPYREAAQILGVQEGTAKSRVFRACQLLKDRLWKYAVARRVVQRV